MLLLAAIYGLFFEPGGICGPEMLSVWVWVPVGVVMVAEVMPWLLGHQAANQPLATVLSTCEPSVTCRLTAQTPALTRPSTTVNAPIPGRPPYEVRPTRIWPTGTLVLLLR